MASHLKYNLSTSKSATVDANGDGEIYIGPSKVSERWHVISMSTFIDSTDSSFSPRMRVYKNGHDLVGGTYNPNDDTSGGDSIELRNNERLKFVLSGAEPGRIWTISVGGTGYAV